MTSATVASTVRVPGAVGAARGAAPRCARAARRTTPAPADERLGGVAVEHVGGADEVGDEPVGRVLVDVAGPADLFDAAVVEHGEPVAQRERLVLVVGDDDEGDADLALNGLELDLHLLAQLEVERAERLVEQQHAWPADERAGQRDALALAARQLGRAARRRGRRAGPCRGRRRCACVVRPCAHPAHLQAVLDVLGHRHVGEERVLLEHRVDVAAAGGQRGDVDAAEPDGARGGLFEAGDHAQHRGLARSGRARGWRTARRRRRSDRRPRRRRPRSCRVRREHLAHADQFDLRLAGCWTPGRSRMAIAGMGRSYGSVGPTAAQRTDFAYEA